MPPDALNRMPMELRSLLIESSEGLILVDTGYGDKLTAKQRQQLNLTESGDCSAAWRPSAIAPEDVRLVINTHLHADHCGGNTRFGPDGTGRRRPFPMRPI